MKRFVSIFIFAFLLFPMVVFAQNVEIKEVKMVEKSENAEIVANPKVNELAIDFNIKLNALNDYVKYKVILNNKDDVDYIISKSDFEDNEYISYDIESDNLEKLEAKKEKVIYLTIKYEKKIPEEVFLDNKYVLSNNFSFTLDDGKEEVVTTNEITNREEQIKNPETGLKDYGIIVGVSIGVLAIVIYCFNRNKKFFKPLVLILVFGCLLYPVVGKAIILMKFSMETTVTIEKGVALYEISINPNGGTYEDKEETTKVKLINGKTYNVSKPKREGFIFSRWEVEGKTSSIYDKETDKIKIVSSDILLKAVWVSESNIIAKIKETGIVYESIQAAYEAAKDKETVILMNDTTENTINTKNITFDLNGHTQNGSLENKGDILLYGGSIKSEDIAIKNEGTLTLGFDDGEVNSYECKVGEDNGCISVIGKNQGIDTQNGTFNFYDGYIKGTIGIVGGCKKTPYSGLTDDGSKLYYHATVDNDKNGYQYVYLTDSSKAVSKTITNGEVYYYNLQDNFNSSMISGYEVYAVRDFEAAYILSVNEDKKILFDVNGYNVQTGNDINNNGTLEIINSNEARGRIESSHSIINNGLLKLSKVKVEGNSNAAIVINNKDLEMVSSTIKGSTGYGVSANESTGTIKMDDDSIIASTSNAGLYISKDVTQTITNGNVKSEKLYGIYNVGTLTLENVNVSSKSSSALYNYGKATFNSGTINSETNYSLYNSGDMIINGGTITGTSYVLYNYQNVEINGGTIKSENNYAFYNVSKVTINGGEIVANKNSAIHNTSTWGRAGNIVINDGIIKTIDSSSTEAAIYNGSTLTITGGFVESTGAYGILTQGTLNIGKDNEELDTTKPIIKGATYGVYISGNTTNFYDGILKGKTSGYYGEFSSVSDGALINSGTEIINSQEYNTNYLVKQQDFLEVNGKKYNSFEKALSNIESSGTIKVIADANINYAMTIPKEKEVILDLNSHMITATVMFTNNGKFRIVDNSNTKKGSIVNNKSVLLQNGNSSDLKPELVITGVNLTTKDTAAISNSYGSVKISDSNIVSETGSSIYNSSGNITIDSSKVVTGNRNAAINNYSTLTINSGEIENSYSYGIYNTGTIVMNGGTIKSTGYAIQNYERFTINGGTIISTTTSGIFNTSTWGHVGYLYVNGGTIKSTGSSNNAHGIQNQHYLTITGGTIESQNGRGVNNSNGTVTIGTLDDNINVSSPTLIGADYGLYITSGIINFYDGILKGKTNGYYGEFSSVVDGTIIKNDQETINGEIYKTNYLVKQSDFLEVAGVKYNSFKKALEAIDSVGEMKVIADANINYAMTVPKEKEITLELNGHTITTSVTFINNGKLTIIDSVGNGKIVNTKSYLVQNSETSNIKGELKLKNVTLKCGISTCVNNYNGDISIDNTEIYSPTSTGVYSSNGTSIVTIKDSLISTDRYSAIDGYSKFIIDNSTIYTKSSYAISNRGNITFNSGDISSDNSYAIYNYSVFVINGGLVESKNNIAIYNTSTYGYSGNMTINGGVVHSLSTNSNSYGIQNGATLTITGGTIDSTNSYGIYNNSSLTIGKSDNNVDIGTPVVKGNTYGLYISGGIVSFYDGILKGQTGGYYGNVSSIQDGYEIVDDEETIDDVVYKTNYLTKKSEYITNVRTNRNYLSLKAAIEETNANDTLKIIANGNNYDEISIPKEKTLTIDFNGNSVKTSKYINNLGTLILKNDTNELPALIINNSAILINNNGTLSLNNIYIKNGTTAYQAINNYGVLNISASKVEGGYGIYNESKAKAIVDDSKIIGRQYALFNRNSFEIRNSSIESESYGLYNDENNKVVSNVIEDSSITLKSVSSNNGLYISRGIIGLDNVDINAGLSVSSGGTLKYDTGNIKFSVINNGIMELKNINIECDGYVSYYNAKSAITNTNKMIFENSQISVISNNSGDLRGIYNSGNISINNVEINLTKETNNGILSGIYQGSGVIEYANSIINVSTGSTVHGIYVYNGDVSLKSGTISAQNSKTSYGIYIENGTVTMGEKEDESGTNYGTINADVSVTNPSIKAISNTFGIGVKRVNGYFNYYDGIITGSTNAKPDVTSTVEYKYQVENHVDPTTGYEYCILEYMKE